MALSDFLAASISTILLILRFGAFWLLLFACISSYTIAYRLAYRTLISATAVPLLGGGSNTQRFLEIFAGITLLVLTVLFKTVWVISWIQCILTPAVFRRKLDPSARDIMQTDDTYIDNHRLPNGTLLWTGLRPLQCPKCAGSRPDRTYHCPRWDRCLPIYDHFCMFLLAPIYLDTIKPFLFLLCFLPLDVVTTMSICSADLVFRWTIAQWPLYTTVFSSVVVISHLLQYGAFQSAYFLAFKNETALDRKSRDVHPPLTFRIDGPSGRHMRWDYPLQHPWDHGDRINLRHALGETWWEWILFFWPPGRVFHYGTSSLGDLPFNKEVYAMYTALSSQQPGIPQVPVSLPERSHLQRSRHRSTAWSSSHEEPRSGYLRQRTDHSSGDR